MPKAKKRKRSILAPILALLLVLALAGTLLFSTFRDKIEHWEYPQRFTEYVEYYAGKYGIDPMILYAFIRTESNFDPNADSDAGARGLMQITEVTFDWNKPCNALVSFSSLSLVKIASFPLISRLI